MKIVSRALKFYIYLFLITQFIVGCTTYVKEKQLYDYEKMDGVTERIHKKIESVIEKFIEEKDPVKISRYTRIDSLIVNEDEEHIDIYLNLLFFYHSRPQENLDNIFPLVQKYNMGSFSH